MMDMKLWQERRDQFNRIFGDQSRLLRSDLKFELKPGREERAALFDWFDLFDQQSRSENTIWQDIADYHVEEAAKSSVEKLELIPVVVLGFYMSNGLASMSEVGTMYVDLAHATENDAPIVFYKMEAEEPTDLGLTLRSLLPRLRIDE